MNKLLVMVSVSKELSKVNGSITKHEHILEKNGLLLAE